MERIHQDSLEILWERGMKIEHPEALSMLTDAGASIEEKTQMVRYPSELVERCLETVPKSFILAGRDPEQFFTIGLGLGPFSRILNGTKAYIDPQSREYRLTTADDLRQWAHLVEHLSNIHICAGSLPQDIPKEIREITLVKTMMQYCSKPIIISSEDPKQWRTIIEMAVIIRGSREALRERPYTMCLTSTTAPAGILNYCIDVILLSGKYGIPLELNSTPLMGGTCPITSAGGILQTNLEVLSLIVISQVANPGAPIIHRGIPIALDMATGASTVASIECAISMAALTQLAVEKYKIPVTSFGMVTDAIVADGQSQMERTIETFLSALSGSSILAGAGQVDRGNALDPVQLVIDDQLLDLVFRTLKKTEVNEITLAKELIKNTGPGGNYLDTDHTLQHFKNEHLLPKCLNRLDRTLWEADGAKDLSAIAKEQALKILKEYKGVTLDDHAHKELDNICGIFNKEVTS